MYTLNVKLVVKQYSDYFETISYACSASAMLCSNVTNIIIFNKITFLFYFFCYDFEIIVNSDMILK